MPEYLCAFDIGTSGVKAAIFTSDGKMVSSAYHEYGVYHPAPGWVEQSINEMWQAQCLVSRQVMARAGIQARELAAIGLSTQRATFVPVDRNEQPLLNFIGWQDKRGNDQIEWMKMRVSESEYYAITGLPLEPTAAVSKMLWVQQNLPEIFEKTYYFASTQNVHLHQLGVYHSPCDLADAAYFGLLDVENLEWSEQLLDRLSLPPDKLPSLENSGVQVGKLSSEAAREMGLVAGIPLVMGGGDLQCAGVGLGITQPGRISVGIGTGGGILTYLETPLLHPKMSLNVLPHAVAGAWEMEGICLASGASYKWLRDLLDENIKTSAGKLGIDAYDFMTANAKQVPVGSNGLLVMPSLIGSGAPNWYPNARGVILGLSLDTDRKALIRAFMEGICLEIRWMLEAVQGLGLELQEVRIWGGAARSSFWNQIATDIYGLPAIRTKVDDAGLVGAAICAGVGIGTFENAQQGVQAMVHVAERYEPDNNNIDFYNDLFDLYKTVYESLRESNVFERLRNVSN